MDLIDSLKRILKRTERDVAVAGAMVGSVTAMAKLFPEMETYSTLTVTLVSGSPMWTVAPLERGSGPWNDFVKWYHGRPQSPSYVMPHKDGCTMFRREDVRAYAIHYGERKKESAS